MGHTKVEGKYNTCDVYTTNVDDTTILQLNELMNQYFIEGEHVAIMPDCHAGKGCVIGTTMTLNNRKVVPNLVGVDIGCGLLAVKVSEREIDFEKLDDVIRRYIPSGFNIHKKTISRESNIDKIKAEGVNLKRAYQSIGTLGGGNHFIEVDKDEDGYLWLVVHTGSRHLGIEVCNYYQKLGYKKLCGGNEKSIEELSDKLIKEYKESGREGEISEGLKELKKNYKSANISEDLAYVENEDFDDYIYDMKLTQEYAAVNRATIVSQILTHMDLHEVDRFDTIHNYIDTENMILRKGAISAQKGERVLIPMNMRDGSLICIGKGNPEWNCSAPHGAGRVMSRNEARKNVKLEDFVSSMEGIYTTSVCKKTIDESAFVYKPMKDIVDNITETVDIVTTLKPIYNFKAKN